MQQDAPERDLDAAERDRCPAAQFPRRSIVLEVVVASR